MKFVEDNEEHPSPKTYDYLVYLFGLGVLTLMFKVLLDMTTESKKRSIKAKFTVGPVSKR